MMEVKNWTYEELPEFEGRPEGADVIETTGDEPGVSYLHDVEYANIDGTPLHLQILVPVSRTRGFSPFEEEQKFSLPC